MDNFDPDASPTRRPTRRPTPAPVPPSLSIECGICVAAGTTACTDCVVSHLVANDDGPIDYVPVPLVSSPSPAERAVDRAVALFVRCGLLDDPIEYVDPAEFEHGLAVRVGA